eukprot:Nk52_evm4s2256 gene=Nk52_evmTU4s2256
MKVLSIDCGIKNLAFCIYDTGTEKILLWKNLNTVEETDCAQLVCKELNKNGKTCDKRAKYRGSTEGQTTFFCQRHKTEDSSEVRNVKGMTVLQKCAAVAESLKGVMDELVQVGFDVIYIENQPKFNPGLKNISMVIFSFFIINGKTNIKFINAKHKNKLQGLPSFGIKANSYTNRKKLAILQTKYLLEQNNQEFLEFFDSNKKQDDLCDCFLQALVNAK